MKTTDIIARAGRNLRRAKMRTILTSVAIAVGGFAIMASGWLLPVQPLAVEMN